MKITNYYTTGTFHYAIGDFFQGTDQVITSFERDKYKLTIYTGAEPHIMSLKLGEQLKFEDGSFETIKSKYDQDNY